MIAVVEFSKGVEFFFQFCCRFAGKKEKGREIIEGETVSESYTTPFFLFPPRLSLSYSPPSYYSLKIFLSSFLSLTSLHFSTSSRLFFLSFFLLVLSSLSLHQSIPKFSTTVFDREHIALTETAPRERERARMQRVRVSTFFVSSSSSSHHHYRVKHYQTYFPYYSFPLLPPHYH